ncbi:MAG: hypothetical protein QW685_10000 [Saccharolobus sp.]
MLTNQYLILGKKGVIIKEKIDTPKKGRRAYAYRSDFQIISKKVENDLDNFMKNIKNKIAIVTGLQIERDK